MQGNAPSLARRPAIPRDVDRDLETPGSGTSQNVVGHGDNYNAPVFGRFVGGRHNINVDRRRESFVVDRIATSTQPYRQPLCLTF